MFAQWQAVVNNQRVRASEEMREAELAARHLERAVSELHEAKQRAGKLAEELQNAAAALQDKACYTAMCASNVASAPAGCVHERAKAYDHLEHAQRLATSGSIVRRRAKEACYASLYTSTATLRAEKNEDDRRGGFDTCEPAPAPPPFDYLGSYFSTCGRRGCANEAPASARNASWASVHRVTTYVMNVRRGRGDALAQDANDDVEGGVAHPLPPGGPDVVPHVAAIPLLSDARGKTSRSAVQWRYVRALIAHYMSVGDGLLPGQGAFVGAPTLPGVQDYLQGQMQEQPPRKGRVRPDHVLHGPPLDADLGGGNPTPPFAAYGWSRQAAQDVDQKRSDAIAAARESAKPEYDDGGGSPIRAMLLRAVTKAFAHTSKAQPTRDAMTHWLRPVLEILALGFLIQHVNAQFIGDEPEDIVHNDAWLRQCLHDSSPNDVVTALSLGSTPWQSMHRYCKSPRTSSQEARRASCVAFALADEVAVVHGAAADEMHVDDNNDGNDNAGEHEVGHVLHRLYADAYHIAMQLDAHAVSGRLATKCIEIHQRNSISFAIVSGVAAPPEAVRRTVAIATCELERAARAEAAQEARREEFRAAAIHAHHEQHVGEGVDPEGQDDVPQLPFHQITIDALTEHPRPRTLAFSTRRHVSVRLFALLIHVAPERPLFVPRLTFRDVRFVHGTGPIAYVGNEHGAAGVIQGHHERVIVSVGDVKRRSSSNAVPIVFSTSESMIGRTLKGTTKHCLLPFSGHLSAQAAHDQNARFCEPLQGATPENALRVLRRCFRDFAGAASGWPVKAKDMRHHVASLTSDVIWAVGGGGELGATPDARRNAMAEECRHKAEAHVASYVSSVRSPDLAGAEAFAEAARAPCGATDVRREETSGTWIDYDALAGDVLSLHGFGDNGIGVNDRLSQVLCALAGCAQADLQNCITGTIEEAKLCFLRVAPIRHVGNLPALGARWGYREHAYEDATMMHKQDRLLLLRNAAQAVAVAYDGGIPPRFVEACAAVHRTSLDATWRSCARGALNVQGNAATWEAAGMRNARDNAALLAGEISPNRRTRKLWRGFQSRATLAALLNTPPTEHVRRTFLAPILLRNALIRSERSEAKKMSQGTLDTAVMSAEIEYDHHATVLERAEATIARAQAAAERVALGAEAHGVLQAGVGDQEEEGDVDDVSDDGEHEEDDEAQQAAHEDILLDGEDVDGDDDAEEDGSTLDENLAVETEHLDVTDEDVHNVTMDDLSTAHFPDDDATLAELLALCVRRAVRGRTDERARRILLTIKLWRTSGGHGIHPEADLAHFGSLTDVAAMDVSRAYFGGDQNNPDDIVDDELIGPSISRAQAIRRLEVLAFGAGAIAHALEIRGTLRAASGQPAIVETDPARLAANIREHANAARMQLEAVKTRDSPHAAAVRRDREVEHHHATSGAGSAGRARRSVRATVREGREVFQLEPLVDVLPIADDDAFHVMTEAPSARAMYATGGAAAVLGWVLYGTLFPAIAVAGDGRPCLTFIVANNTALDADVPPCGTPFWILPRAAALVVLTTLRKEMDANDGRIDFTKPVLRGDEDD
ncbi:hypothetical protein RI054_26g108000 [Pseudoscourfieldia marina]